MSIARTSLAPITLRLFLPLVWLLPLESAYAQKNVASDITEHLQLAGKLQRQGEPVRAASEFREALGLTLEQLGAIYRTLGDLGKAELAYRSAIEARAYSDDAQLALAIVYMKKAEPEKGVEAVKRLLSQNPLNPAARHVLGKLYFIMNRPDLAAFELEEAARLAPDDFSVATTLAMAYVRQGRLENAMRILNQMLERLGESARLHVFFGALYREAEALAEAVAEFRRAAYLDPKYPRVHYYLGLSYLQREGRAKTDEAVAEFQTELRRDPTDYLANYLLGLVYLKERKLEAAVPLFETAMHADARNPDAPLYLGQTLSLLGRDERAIPILQKAIDLTQDPRRNHYQIATAHYLLAQALRRQGKMEQAASHADLAAKYRTEEASHSVESLELYVKSSSASPELTNNSMGAGGTVIIEPEVPDEREKARLGEIEKVYVRIAGGAYNQLALLSAAQSDFGRAAKYFEQAVYWDPEISDIDYNLGLARFKAGQFREAVSPLSRALVRQPDRLPARVLLGLSYFYSEDYSRAVEQLGPPSDSGIDDPQVLFALGLSLASVGNRQRGEQILLGLLQKYPQVADLHLAMGRLRALEGDYASASAEFSKAVEMNPSLPDAHYYSGLSMLKQSKFGEAADEFRKEIALNPRHAKAHYHLGFAQVSVQQVEDAVKQFEEAIHLDPAYVDAYYELGKLLLSQGHTSDAIELLEKAAQLDSNKSYVYYQLSQAYLKAGRQAAAEGAVSRYRELKAKERGSPP